MMWASIFYTMKTKLLILLSSINLSFGAVTYHGEGHTNPTTTRPLVFSPATIIDDDGSWTVSLEVDKSLHSDAHTTVMILADPLSEATEFPFGDLNKVPFTAPLPAIGEKRFIAWFKLLDVNGKLLDQTDIYMYAKVPEPSAWLPLMGVAVFGLTLRPGTNGRQGFRLTKR